MKTKKFSPYTFKYENGIYSQINKESGITISEICVAERDRLCDFIREIDELMWNARARVEAVSRELETLKENANKIQKLFTKLQS